MLNILQFSQNLLRGFIPSAIGTLQKLNVLALDANYISGEIPSSVGNLTQLVYLLLDANQLSGVIPSSIGNCQQLFYLTLQSNKLTGSIPKEILNISTLSRILNLASNSLTGPIPVEVGNLKNIGIIDFSMNELSGEIPSTLSECQVLEQLSLEGNFLRGSIPPSLESLRGIQVLDVSRNNLSGRIPDFLQDYRDLHHLNLSFNDFEGELPRHVVFQNSSAVAIIGNNKLCGGSMEVHLPACRSQLRDKKNGSHKLAVIIGIASLFLLLMALSCFLIRCWVRSSRRKANDSVSIREQHVKLSYAELVKATNHFSVHNVVGSGSFGTVYKGTLDEDGRKVVAVKVLNLQTRGAAKSFTAECEALRSIRHRNLVKIITACSSIDFRGNDFKAVVFEFMNNGSLEDWLHPNENEQVKPKKLSLKQRLNIAIDVASALDYLHHQGETPIIHCDLKPSNILLDDDMTAHVGDFGLAKFLKNVVSNSSGCSTSSVGLKGTIGYIAPEYGMANRVSTHGDVYSYGILLLEMFTARRPTDDLFKGSLCLRKYVEMAFPERIIEIYDSHLLSEGEDEEPSEDDVQNMNGVRAMECIARMLSIGFSCSNELPEERMETGELIRELHKIRDVFLRNGSQGERSEARPSGEGLSTIIQS